MRKPFYFFGFIVAVSSLFFAFQHLGLEKKSLYDFVAFMAVMGGTVAVGISTLPWDNWRATLACLKNGFIGVNVNYKSIIHSSQKLIMGEDFNMPLNKNLSDEVLSRGTELISLQFEPNKIEEILRNVIDLTIEEKMKVANSVRSLSKYPPAFGLAGTVLGLIHVISSLNEGSDAAKIGLEMSVALLATFYGIIVANLFVNPLGDSIKNQAEEEQKVSEIALSAVLLRAHNTPSLLAHETFLSYLPGQYSASLSSVGSEDLDIQPQENLEEAA